MTSIIPFVFDGQPVRTVVIDGGPWFVLADVCRALNLSAHKGSYSGHADKLDDDEKRQIARHLILESTPVLKPGVLSEAMNYLGAQVVNAHDPIAIDRAAMAFVISESGLYTVILRCRDATTQGTLPYRFRKWVTAEVLPALRRTGSYAMPQGDKAADGEALPDLDDPEVERLWQTRITLALRAYGPRAAREVWQASPLPQPSRGAQRGDLPRDPAKRRRQPPPVMPEVRAEMVRRFRNGEKAEALAREIGVSRHAIHIWNRRQAQRDRMHGRPPA